MSASLKIKILYAIFWEFSWPNVSIRNSRNNTPPQSLVVYPHSTCICIYEWPTEHNMNIYSKELGRRKPIPFSFFLKVEKYVYVHRCVLLPALVREASLRRGRLCRHSRLAKALRTSRRWVLSSKWDSHIRGIAPGSGVTVEEKEKHRSQIGRSSTKHHLLGVAWQLHLWSLRSNGSWHKVGSVNPASRTEKEFMRHHAPEKLWTANGKSSSSVV